jgi:hypothetical protein
MRTQEGLLADGTIVECQPLMDYGGVGTQQWPSENSASSSGSRATSLKFVSNYWNTVVGMFLIVHLEWEVDAIFK